MHMELEWGGGRRSFVIELYCHLKTVSFACCVFESIPGNGEPASLFPVIQESSCIVP